MGFLINLVLWFFFSSPTIRTNGDDEVINLPPCDYSTMYNFGDSNSDTGGIAAAFYPPASPSGETYYGRPVGRASDGRLIIDFIAENLGLPYLSPYLDSVGSSYQNGANFATGGATILRPNGSWFDSGLSPFNLEIQVEHFTQFKDRTAYLYGQAQDECTRKRLPRPENFSEALFTLDIGQNDVAVGIRSLSYELQQAVVPNILSQFITQVRGLYERGARTFWVHNTGPIGCLPVAIAKVKDPAPGYLDENGCVKSQNDIALQFNEELKDEIVKLRAELSDAAIVYVDMYAAKYELITNAKNQGFEDPFEICCGYHGIGYDVWCGNKGNVNGTEVYAGSCEDPSKIISWDGVHYTEAANHWIANRIVNGSMSDPSIPITSACHARANLSALGFF
ncbi:GDSL esterase/lipase At5g14450 isoform X1 [Sesamum indicum]|uniref:GDSL esterase/lipase At5g14450 isoform X1 n=1 Tax=Sesamum indicum TaxID=4182 RepID=A0A6I9URK4_SESIN|nr:GDSL esterase/lipase At5g14450 isoform X1 [Sesamum indicum]